MEGIFCLLSNTVKWIWIEPIQRSSMSCQVTIFYLLSTSIYKDCEFIKVEKVSPMRHQNGFMRLYDVQKCCPFAPPMP